MKVVKIISIALLIGASTLANAGLITIDDWHDSSGPVEGLRQASFDSSIYFAVAKDINFSVNDTYEMYNGYHIATASEYTTLFENYVSANGMPPNTYVYYGQEGWGGYFNTSGARNYYFAFADMFDVNETPKAAHAGAYEQSAAHEASNIQFGSGLKTELSLFAGLVLIKDDIIDPVPEPSTLAIFALGMIGLVSRRFKKQS